MMGLISRKDKLHNIAAIIFENIQKNVIKNIAIPTSALLEYELVLRSKEINNLDVLKDIINFQNLPNIKEVYLNSEIIISALKLRNQYILSYFDSLHCASAINFDGKIIGTDKEYEKIPQIQLIDPSDFIE